MLTIGASSSAVGSALPCSAFFLAGAGGGSASSEDEQPSSESPSPSFSLTWDCASADIYLSSPLFRNNFLHSQNAFSTYLPTFIKSRQLKCLPAILPLAAPANEASSVKTKGIRSLWNIYIRAVASLLFGIEKVQSWKLK